MRVFEQVTRCGFKTLLKAVVYCYTGSVSLARESEVTSLNLEPETHNTRESRADPPR
jgi:hypothetical protein